MDSKSDAEMPEQNHGGAQEKETAIHPTRSEETLRETSNAVVAEDPNRPLDLTKTASRAPSAVENPNFSFPREAAFIFIIISAQLYTQAALALGIAPLHNIGKTFDITNPGVLSWLPAGYSLTVGTFILPAGRWGDLFGHKKLYVIGFMWFALWSLICGFAAFSHNTPFFAFCRAMQGIGPAITIPNGIAVLARTYPPGNRKNMALSLFGAAAPGGFILGAVFAGLLTEFVWWPWSYWVLGIVLFATGIGAIFIIPRQPVIGAKPSFQEVDIIGTLLGVSGLVMFNFAWNEGAAAGFQKAYVIVFLILGCASLTSFMLYEIKLAKFPLLPVSAFTRDTSFVFGCIAAAWASFGIYVYYFWQFDQNLQGDSILLVTAKQSPVAVSGAIAAIVTGLIIGKVQPGFIMLASMSAFLTGGCLLATNRVGESYWAQQFVAMVLLPWGMDMSFPSSVIVLSNHMPAEQQGLAASLVNTVINYSISIGLGMAGTVEGQVNDGGRNLLRGYRGAGYLGIGLDCLGLTLAVGLIFSWRATLKARAAKEMTKTEV